MADFFSGQSEHTLDAKGRVIVPAKYRARFADGAFLAKDKNRSLALWTRTDYERQANSWLEKLESEDQALVKQAKFWAANVEEVAVDASTGRLLIPPKLREHAQLESGQPVVLNGALNHIDVWNPSIYNERIAADAEQEFTGDTQ
ncbi:MAG: hypothetical protein Q8K63_02735 [Acidimicrobiales bacterium]|nr:hypothetical protein [Acidimicrobiales bacterium]